MNRLSMLEKNVKNIWDQQGQIWLNQLPEIIKLLSEHWSLVDMEPVKNMNYNYVALAKRQNKRPVVIEDNGTPDEMLNLASTIFPLINANFQTIQNSGEYHDH